MNKIILYIATSKDELDAIREATNKGWVLGLEAFKHQLEKTVNRPTMPAAKGGDRRSSSFKGS